MTNPITRLNAALEGRYSVERESTNFTVLRLRRDVFRRSSVGALFTGRSTSAVVDGSNQTFGLDASFSFFRDLSLTGYYAKTRTPGLSEDDRSYLGSFSYNGDLWGATMEHLLVGENFNPEVGFLRRRGFRQTSVSGRFSPRPASIKAIRKLTFQASLDYLEHAQQRFVESRQGQGQFQIEFESSDALDLTYTDSYEFLDSPSAPASPSRREGTRSRTWRSASASVSNAGTLGPWWCNGEASTAATRRRWRSAAGG